MKSNFFKIITVIIFISLCILLYVAKTNSLKHNGSVDLTGSDAFWKVSLNIALNYNSELIIRPATDEFEIPSEINVGILVKDKCVYTDNLKFITSYNFENYGKYTVRQDSNKYLERNYKDVSVVIRFNDKTSKILLKERIFDRPQ